MLQLTPILNVENAMRSLLPAGVALSLAESRATSALLLDEERESVRHANGKRLREFAIARNCARTAFRELGLSPVAIPRDAAGAPVWPSGVVGSISHCEEFCCALVARTPAIKSVGVDIEGSEPVTSAQAAIFCAADEVALFQHLPLLHFTNWEKIAFCAKEAYFKAFYCLAGGLLDFKDIIVDFSQPSGSAGCFGIRLRNTALLQIPLWGRWGYAEETVFAFAIFGDALANRSIPGAS
jgi:4'-phosphopantetheinyl transferase EntD